MPSTQILEGLAAGYDCGSGWSAIAEEQNFAVLLQISPIPLCLSERR